MTSTLSLALRRRGESTVYLPPLGSPGLESPLPRYHPSPSRNEVAVVQPVLVRYITLASAILLIATCDR